MPWWRSSTRFRMRKSFIIIHVAAIALVMPGITILLHADPWGKICTYAGFGLLSLALLWRMLHPKGAFRRLLRGAALALPLLLPSVGYAAPTLSRAQAEAFGRLHILYRGRPALFDTYARDFTRKLTGRDGYGSYTATQVALGFVFFPDEWDREPLVRIKSKALRQRFGLPGRASVAEIARRPESAKEPVND